MFNFEKKTVPLDSNFQQLQFDIKFIIFGLVELKLLNFKVCIFFWNLFEFQIDLTDFADWQG